MRTKKTRAKVVVPKGCPECSGDLVEAVSPFSHGEVFFGNYLFWACVRCGYEVVPPDTARLLERVAQAKGLWGTGFRLDKGSHQHARQQVPTHA